MKKRWVASLLTVAMMISVMSPLSAYADDGDEMFDDDCGYVEECDMGADEEGIHYYTEGDFGGGDAMIATQAVQTYTLDQLRAKYPAGKYWNHVGSSTNNPGGYTSTPCSDHWNASTQKYGIGAYDNYYYGALGWATQCAGFANQLAYCYTGSDPQTWTKLTDISAVDNLKTGDVVRYRNDGHSIFVTAVSGDTVYFADCNWGNQCIIRWDKTISKSEIKKSFTSVRVAPGTTPQPPVDTCSEQYAGWYKVTNSDGINVNSGHNFSSQIAELPYGTLVYITKASGLGRSQIGHIQYNGQECYLAMNLLTRMSGVEFENASFGITEENKVDDYLNGRVTFKGSVFDWSNLNEKIQVRVVADSGQEATGTADRSGHNVLDRYTIGTTDQKNQGDYHDFEIAVSGLPVGDHSFRLEVYAQGNWVELGSTTKISMPEVHHLLKVATLPDKMEYAVGETLDTSGLVLNEIYTLNESTWNLEENSVTNGFTCTPETLDTVGTQTITVSYNGGTTSFDVTVKAKTTTNPGKDDTTTTKPGKDDTEDQLESLEIETMPYKTTYVSGETLDTTGLTLKATYSVSGEKIITDGYRCDLNALYVTGNRTVTVKYGGATTTFNVVVKESSENTTTPSNPTTNPTTPSKPGNTVTTPSDDGSGMAAALLVGGAVVVVGGIVMMAMTAMPVEVRAAVRTGDNASVANVPVALLQGDRVVAETVTDGNGQFTFNVQRGDYTLRLTVTDPVTGQPSVRYASVSAPVNSSTVWF